MGTAQILRGPLICCMSPILTGSTCSDKIFRHDWHRSQRNSYARYAVKGPVTSCFKGPVTPCFKGPLIFCKLPMRSHLFLAVPVLEKPAKHIMHVLRQKDWQIWSKNSPRGDDLFLAASKTILPGAGPMSIKSEPFLFTIEYTCFKLLN